jgi:hypothetical protein
MSARGTKMAEQTSRLKKEIENETDEQAKI